MKKPIAAVALSVALISGCGTDADVASYNLSKAAENFEVNRRIVFYNGITDTYMLSVEGLCSVDILQLKTTVTCKTGPGQYKKHYLGKADNITFFAEQLGGSNVSIYHYKVVFKPSVIIPDVDVKL